MKMYTVFEQHCKVCLIVQLRTNSYITACTGEANVCALRDGLYSYHHYKRIHVCLWQEHSQQTRHVLLYSTVTWISSKQQYMVFNSNGMLGLFHEYSEETYLPIMQHVKSLIEDKLAAIIINAELSICHISDGSTQSTRINVSLFLK